MGDLIVLSRSKASDRLPVEGQTAEILFFTGVRYYRMDDAAVPAPVKQRRRTKKTAELLRRAELHG